MKYVLMMIALFMAMVTMAQAQTTTNCVPPCPPCPAVAVETTCQCDCKCTETVLPGLWRVPIAGIMRCGEITVVGSGFILDQGDGAPEFFLINRLKRARQVEVCP